MKKGILVLLLAGVMIMVTSGLAISQEKPKAKKDTINMDSNAKPTFYYAVEDDKAVAPPKTGGITGTIIMIAGAVIIVGATAFFFFRKKK